MMFVVLEHSPRRQGLARAGRRRVAALAVVPARPLPPAAVLSGALSVPVAVPAPACAVVVVVGAVAGGRLSATVHPRLPVEQ